MRIMPVVSFGSKSPAQAKAASAQDLAKDARLKNTVVRQTLKDFVEVGEKMDRKHPETEDLFVHPYDFHAAGITIDKKAVETLESMNLLKTHKFPLSYHYEIPKLAVDVVAQLNKA